MMGNDMRTLLFAAALSLCSTIAVAGSSDTINVLKKSNATLWDVGVLRFESYATPVVGQIAKASGYVVSAMELRTHENKPTLHVIVKGIKKNKTYLTQQNCEDFISVVRTFVFRTDGYNENKDIKYWANRKLGSLLLPRDASENDRIKVGAEILRKTSISATLVSVDNSVKQCSAHAIINPINENTP